MPKKSAIKYSVKVEKASLSPLFHVVLHIERASSKFLRAEETRFWAREMLSIYNNGERICPRLQASYLSLPQRVGHVANTTTKSSSMNQVGALTLANRLVKGIQHRAESVR